MDRHAGLDKKISPNPLRQAFVIPRIDAGVTTSRRPGTRQPGRPRPAMTFDRARRTSRLHESDIIAG